MALYKYIITFKGKEIIESEYEFSNSWEAERIAQQEIDKKINEIDKYYPDYEIDDINLDDIDINTYENDFDCEIKETFFDAY